MLDWLIGFSCSLFVAGYAYRRQSLSLSGVLAAVTVGTLQYALGGFFWYGLTLLFFITSTMLTRWKKQRKAAVEGVYQKTGRRDAGQVLANGGLGTLLCVLYAWNPELWWLPVGYIGVTATVTADTWATEVGSLSRRDPRSIVTWRRVPKGTSGGVSSLGQAAAFAGSLAVGVFALLVLHGTVVGGAPVAGIQGLLLVAAAAVSGWIGANVDSLLGALLQGAYRCGICGLDVEGRRHCGAGTRHVKGLRWLDNDAVNFISSVLGGILPVLLWLFISRASA